MRPLHSTLLFRWFDEVWNQDRPDVIPALVHTEATIRGLVPDDDARGPAAFRAFYDQFRADFQDIHIEVEKVVSEDDYEVALCAVRAQHRTSGTPVSFSGLCMVHLQDGQIYEGWNHFDFGKLQEQLAPAAAMA
ncbi:ester cyclase [Hymenobacter busanensis]|nr:ester cyclase [Hymenobacter busanensis]QHJ09493.1 hypothetical protein GUY19_20345 [Hymenobacter busanensis]